MRISAEEALGSVRRSLGRSTTSAHVERAAAMLLQSWETLTQ
jgi:cysteine sulfinate desulfinase/cysteine desulfurase-like protein